MYCALNLNLRRKGKKRLPSRHPEPLAVPETANACWSIEVDANLPAARAIRVLDRIAVYPGYPAKLRLDNGPELVSVAMAGWAEEHGVALTREGLQVSGGS